ncbi:MAG: hypothetical protein IKR25_02170 [Muribaculaceae bacterium]|nr:hypothetical protein [Muribaculaceae bacterium]
MNRCKLLFLLTICILGAIAQAHDAQAVAERLDLQRYNFPQEKMHVLTDRSRYLAGDTIWLRAWVVDAATHQPVNASRFIYIDLVSPIDSVMARVKLHSNDQGLFSGYVPLDIDLPEGRYQLTAYTMFMQSVGTDYFHRQPIEVAALPSLKQRITSRCTRYGNEVDMTLRFEDANTGELLQNKVFAYQDADGRWNERRRNTGKEVHLTLKGKDASRSSMLVVFDYYAKFITLPPSENAEVSFYPEGGYLVPGVENMMTFKLHDSTTALSGGTLLDADGNEVARLAVEHDGMGMVRFVPVAGVRYTAQWHDPADQPLIFDVPPVRPEATVVQVRRTGNDSITLATAGAQRDALLVVQQRGQLLATGRDTLTLCEHDLPAGVVQAMAFDDQWRCLSERLLFVAGDSALTPAITTDRAAYTHRQPIAVTVDLRALAPQATDYAVSVTDNRATAACEANILAQLLLQSDLRGIITRPAYYFEPCPPAEAAVRSRHLDLLLLTQGWRRYDIPRVLRGRLTEPQFPIEQAQVVSGRVRSDWRKKPVVGADVSLIAPRIGFSNKVVSDTLGEFAITMPLMPDSVECIVVAENMKGKKQMNLELDSEQFPQLYYALCDSAMQAPVADAREQAWRIEHSGDWRHIMLHELTVTAPQLRLPTTERDAFTLSGTELLHKSINSVEGLAYALPGLIVFNGDLYTSGGQARDLVNIVVDGESAALNFANDRDIMQEIIENASPFERNALGLAVQTTAFSPNYGTSQLDVAQGMISFRDVEYAHFSPGAGGHGGVLIVSHKKGFKGSRGEPSRFLKIARPLGVQQPAEFYMPRYSNGNNCGYAPDTDLRNTLYWNPCVAVTHNGLSTISFCANDAPSTTYTITIEGITQDGTPFHATQQVLTSN